MGPSIPCSNKKRCLAHSSRACCHDTWNGSSARGCNAPLAYLYLGPEMIAPGEARATSLAPAGCFGVRYGGHGARHQVPSRMWLCSLLFQAGHAIRRRSLRRKKGRDSVYHQRSQQRRRATTTSGRRHQPYVRTGDYVCACVCSVPIDFTKAVSRNQTIR
jgi:hypothetical protein